MTYASMSSKYQIVIPKEVRDRLPMRPGQKFLVMEKDGVIHLIPDMPLSKLKGVLKDKNLDASEIRDKSDKP